ncbi:MAG: thioredoxin family protein [Thermaerobacter sp.]|jgi:thioredoxin-like negative regulator of GroEL|nr:thioredoxin family protein [Thermaerobacter sp.]
MREAFVAMAIAALLGLWLAQRWIVALQRRRQQGSSTEDADGIYLFTTPTCRVCARMKEVHASTIRDGAVRVVDLAENPAAARRYGILSVPTTLVVRHGVVVESFHGFVPPSELARWLPEN